MVEGLSYEINKGVGRPIEFRGLKGIYIYILAIGLAVLMVVFAITYIAGVPVFLLLPAVVLVGSGLFVTVYRMSSRFGTHGLMKAMASRQVPAAIVCRSRKAIQALNANDDKGDKKK